MKLKTTRCWNCHVHTTHVDDGDNENIGCPNCGRMLFASKPKPGVTRHSVALGRFGDEKKAVLKLGNVYRHIPLTDDEEPKVILTHSNRIKIIDAPKKELGYFGGYKPRSWTDAIVGDITSPKVLAEMLADAKAKKQKNG